MAMVHTKGRGLVGMNHFGKAQHKKHWIDQIESFEIELFDYLIGCKQMTDV